MSVFFFFICSQGMNVVGYGDSYKSTTAVDIGGVLIWSDVYIDESLVRYR